MHAVDVPVVVLISESDAVPPAELVGYVEPYQAYVDEQLAQAYPVAAKIVALADGEAPPAGAWCMRFKDELEDPKAGGFHIDPNGLPELLINAHDEPMLTGSHELAEALVDPEGDSMYEAPSPDPADKGKVVKILREICDPCEDASFAIQVAGAELSDFITNSYCTGEAAPYDAAGELQAPRELGVNGYISWIDGKVWKQATNFAGQGFKVRVLGPVEAQAEAGKRPREWVDEQTRAHRRALSVSSRLELPGLAPTTLGPGERFFADPKPGEDEPSLQVPNNSIAYFDSAYYKAHENDLQPFPAPRTTPPRIDLEEIVGVDVLAVRTNEKKISFHVVGDTGASSEVSLDSEAAVADAMTRDLSVRQRADAPAFCFHLGDVIYYFGEPQYYYDQFYEPFRGYAAPIFAIPGNHDGFPEEGTASLFAFLRNFCTVSPERSPDAQGLMRGTMTQPGVYFTLRAPFVSVIGLYSNVLEGPGVISSEGGKWPIGDQQLEFLTSELKALKHERDELKRAVVLAVHHPPIAKDEFHPGTLGLSEDIDKACRTAELWPDVILSGHVHLYQRFTRTIDETFSQGVDEIELPYIVSGSGGHAAKRPKPEAELEPPNGFTMPVGPTLQFGYLTVMVDMGEPKKLTVTFNSTAKREPLKDSITLDLATRKLITSRSR